MSSSLPKLNELYRLFSAAGYSAFSQKHNRLKKCTVENSAAKKQKC